MKRIASFFNAKNHDATTNAQTEKMHSSDGASLYPLVLSRDANGMKEFLSSKTKEEQHDLLWERGAEGEIPLHLTYLVSKNEMAEYMISLDRKQLTDVYTGDKYKGENVLHIAIVHRDATLVRWLVEQDTALLRAMATGDFFSNGQPCYYGESPLHFAACTNQPACVDYLLAKGAKFDSDSNGNNILHMCVIHGLVDMFDFVENRLESLKATMDVPPLRSQMNSDGLTPFMYAAYLGKEEMFVHLLEKGKNMLWAYGPVSCWTYPLLELDTINHALREGADRDEQHKHAAYETNALEIIVEREHSALLNNKRVRYLLDKKWETFAESAFYTRLVLVSIYIFVFTWVSLVTRSKGPLERSFLSTVGEFFVVAVASYKFVVEMRELLDGVGKFFGCSGSAFLENVLSLLHCICIMVVTFMRFTLPAETLFELEVFPIVIASLSGWMYMFFFLLGFRVTGPFVIMLYKMLIGDLVRFAIIFFALVSGFAQSFFVLFDEEDAYKIAHHLKQCFLALLGNFELADYTEQGYLATFLLMLYIMVVTILLLNLLIAMLSDTYTSISDSAEDEWRLEHARIILSIESEMTLAERRKHIYWVEIKGETFLQLEDVNADHFAVAPRVEEEHPLPAWVTPKLDQVSLYGLPSGMDANDSDSLPVITDAQPFLGGRRPSTEEPNLLAASQRSKPQQNIDDSLFDVMSRQVSAIRTSLA